MPLVRHPHRGELARAQQLRKAYRIAPVRLHSVAGLLWNERGSHHQALVAEALEQSVEPISCRPCFIAKHQITVFRCKLCHEPSDRRLRGKELPRYRTSPPRPPSAMAIALHDFDVSIPTKASV